MKRNKNTGPAVSRNIDCLLTSTLILLFVSYGLFFGSIRPLMTTVLAAPWHRGLTLPLMWVYLIVAIIIIRNSGRIRSWDMFHKVVFIFSVAFVLRFTINLVSDIEPISDFRNYVNMGKMFVNRHFDWIAGISDSYGLPSFGGIAVFNGIIMHLFSATVFGLQIGDCIITSMIAVMIMYIGSLYSEKLGLVCGVLYAFYPSNIVNSVLPTNQHGATLFLLISVYSLLYVVMKEKNNKTLLCIVSGCSLAASYFMHPSIHTHIIAYTVFVLIIVIRNIKNRTKVLQVLKCGLIIAVSLILSLMSVFWVMKETGLIRQNTRQMTMLSKIVVGLNRETGGGYSSEDYSMFRALDMPEQNELARQVIRERFFAEGLVSNTIFFTTKIDKMWFAVDHYHFIVTAMDEFEATSDAVTDTTNVLARRLLSALNDLDKLYVPFVFLFAALGIVAKLQDSSPIFSLCRWIILGWIGVHLFIEVHPRYRYICMPFFFILASTGIVYVIESAPKIKGFFNGKLKQYINKDKKTRALSKEHNR